MAVRDLHLGSTTGSILAGVILGWIFYACTCGQSIYYARKYPNDRLPLKLLVACLWLLDTSTIILDTQFFWYLAIEHHGDPDVLPVPNTFIAAFFLISLTNCIVQCYFVFNIWRLLSRRWYRLPALIMGLTLAVTSLAGGISTVEKFVISKDIAIVLETAEIPASLQQASSIVTDVYISVSLCLILRGQHTRFKETNSLLTKLTVYAINRGMLTSTVQFLHLLTYLVTLHKVEFIWMIFHVPGSKVYANSLIAVLNVRQHLRRGGFISNPQLSGIMCTTEVYQEEDFPHNITKSHASDRDFS